MRIRRVVLAAVTAAMLVAAPLPVSAAPGVPVPFAPGSSVPGWKVTTLTPTFYWTTVPGADFYRFSVSRNPFGSNYIVYSSPPIYGGSFQIPAGYLADSTQYRWNMRAFDATGSSDYSATLYFDTQLEAPPPPPPSAPPPAPPPAPAPSPPPAQPPEPAPQAPATPQPISPGYGSAPGPAISTLTPRFSWQAAQGAQHYRFSISEYPYGTERIVYTSADTAGTYFDLPGGVLRAGIRYRWNMKAWSSAGWSDYSDSLYFEARLAAPQQPQAAIPVLVSVTAGSSDGTDGLRLEWTAVPGATGYRIYRNGTVLADLATGLTAFLDVYGLTRGSVYTYQVCSLVNNQESLRSDAVSQTFAPAQTSLAEKAGSPLAQAALAMATEIVGAPYLGDGTHGGKGWDYARNRWADPGSILWTGYRWGGGDTRVGVDCSGLVMWAYNYAWDPNSSYQHPDSPVVKENVAGQWADSDRLQYVAVFAGPDAVGQLTDRVVNEGTAALDLRQGDVFYFIRSTGEAAHAGLYAGDGQVIHSDDNREDVRGVTKEAVEVFLSRYRNSGFDRAGIGRIGVTQPRATAAGQTGEAGRISVQRSSSPMFADTLVCPWAVGAIESLASQCIVNGVGEDRFAPMDNVTRAQFAALLQRSLGLRQTMSAFPLIDVPREHWAYSSIEASRQYLNLFSLAGGMAFLPDQDITREDAVAAVVKSLSAAGRMSVLDPGKASTVLSRFGDSSSISVDKRAYVATAVEESILAGFPDGTINPNGTITRAESAALLDRVRGSFLMSSLCRSSSTGSSSAQGFVEALLPHATAASRATGLPVTLVLAQWAHESDWGTSGVACDNNNLAGIKATCRYPGGPLHPEFALFRSLDDFVRAYTDVILLDLYAGVRDAARQGRTATELADLLFRAGYAEDRGYGAKVGGVADMVQRYLVEE